MIFESQRRIGAFKTGKAPKKKGSKTAANFKVVRTAKKPRKRPRARDRRPGMSKPHTAIIRSLPCIISGIMPAGQAHHLKGTGERGMGLRSTDQWTLPLAHGPHMALESEGSKNELQWFADRGIPDPHAVAQMLWAASPDDAAMTRIVIENRGHE